MPLTPEERQLITQEGFENRVQQLATTMALSTAYETAEEEVLHATGLRMYPSVEAYRKRRDRQTARRNSRAADRKRQATYLSNRKNNR